ncbi:AcvB/VirJ family lysyl-phosphatidylglycerol hydrolase [Pedobacter sp. NJ-S-72]
MAQAPANTFKGAVALGFCPDIESKKPLCKGNGLTQHVLKPGFSFWLERNEHLTAPFIVLNGFKDEACPYDATATFLKNMPMAELIDLPKVGHGFAVSADWSPQFIAAFQKVINAPSFAERKQGENKELKTQAIRLYGENLPLTIIPATQKNNLPLVFMISGDGGGWTSFDQSLAESLAQRGLSVVGLDAQKYFWEARTPEKTTSDLSRAILHYRTQLNKDKFVLAGYSFGASVVPFVADRLEPSLKSHLSAVLSLSPDVTADFEIHVMDMLSFGNTTETYNVQAEMKKIKNVPVISFFGNQEGGDIAAKFIRAGLKTEIIPGDHHFGDNFEGLSLP